MSNFGVNQSCYIGRWKIFKSDPMKRHIDAIFFDTDSIFLPLIIKKIARVASFFCQLNKNF